MKPIVNRLVLDKSTGPRESDHTTYYFNWYNNDTLVSTNIMWIFYNDVPMEPYNIDDMIKQRKECCFTIVEPITVEII
jgi:hypothetical protein